MAELIFNCILNFALAMAAAAGFAIIFNAPKKELIHCGVTGAMGWVIYFLSMTFTESATVSTFLGALSLAACSRLFSYTRKAPSTLFLIPGIIPLVPGTNMYNTMKAVLENNLYTSYMEAIKALKLAGAIALGIILIFTLPYKAFEIFSPKKQVK